MQPFKKIQNDIEEIKKRNSRVEADKAWEVSWARKFLILILTYVVIVIFFYFARLPKPFVNAIVPTVGFFLSTLSMPFFKRWWIKKFVQNG